MSIIIYFILAVVLLFRISQKIKKNEIDMFFGTYLGFVFFITIPIFLSFFIGDIVAEGLNIDAFDNKSEPISLYILLYLIGVLLSELLVFFVKNKSIKNNKSTFILNELKTIKFIFAFSITSLLFVFFIGGKLSGNHWAETNIQGSWHTFLLSINLSLRIMLFAIALYFTNLHKKYNYNGVLLVFVIIDVFTTGNRISVLYYVIYYIFANKIDFKKFLLLLLLSFPVFYFTSLYPVFRGLLWVNYEGFHSIIDVFFQVIYSSNLQYNSNMIFNMFEASNLSVFQYVFNNFGHNLDFNYGSTVFLKPFTIMIPRSLWLDKPHGIGAMLGYMISGNDKLSLNTLLIGEYWINFGWFSVFFVMINYTWLYIMIFMSKKLLQYIGIDMHKSLADKISFFMFFSSWRHETNYIYLTYILSLFIYIIIYCFFNKKTDAIRL